MGKKRWKNKWVNQDPGNGKSPSVLFRSASCSSNLQAPHVTSYITQRLPFLYAYIFVDVFTVEKKSYKRDSKVFAGVPDSSSLRNNRVKKSRHEKEGSCREQSRDKKFKDRNFPWMQKKTRQQIQANITWNCKSKTAQMDTSRAFGKYI